MDASKKVTPEGLALIGRVVDLTGQQVGRLRVLLLHPKRTSSGNAQWVCECSCGAETIVAASRLKSGATQSCGCLQKEITSQCNTTHGLHGSTVYSVWSAMLNRCYNKSAMNYDNYGGRGIFVCDRWLSIINFYADMGERPEGASLDRIDNTGNYSPENCRWASRVEQANNKRNSRTITLDGVTQTTAQWARQIGMSCKTLRMRLNSGWSVEDAITIAVRPLKPRLTNG